MFVAKIFNVYKLTVELETQNSSFLHFSRHKKETIYFSSQANAEAYRKDYYSQAEFLIEKKLAINHQGKTKVLEDIKPCKLHIIRNVPVDRIKPVFDNELKKTIDANGPGTLIAAKEIGVNEYKGVDFTTDASHFIHVTKHTNADYAHYSTVKKLKLVAIQYAPVHTPSALDVQEEKYLAARRMR